MYCIVFYAQSCPLVTAPRLVPGSIDMAGVGRSHARPAVRMAGSMRKEAAEITEYEGSTQHEPQQCQQLQQQQGLSSASAADPAAQRIAQGGDIMQQTQLQLQ